MLKTLLFLTRIICRGDAGGLDFGKIPMLLSNLHIFISSHFQNLRDLAPHRLHGRTCVSPYTVDPPELIVGNFFASLDHQLAWTAAVIVRAMPVSALM